MLKAIRIKENVYIDRMSGTFAQLLNTIPDKERINTIEFGYIQGEVFTLVGMAGMEQLQAMLEKRR